ncbi:helicase, partial [Halorubrum halodurans]
PTWSAERLPLSPDLAREVLAFRGELLDRLAAGGPPAVRAWLRELPLDENAVRAIARTYDEQVRYAGVESVPTPSRIVVEETLDREAYKRRFYVHAPYGRRFTDGLSRLVAAECSRRIDAEVVRAVDDDGFSLAVPLNRKVDVAGVIRGLDPTAVREDLRDALAGTDRLKRAFRIVAGRALMVLKRYKGREKTAAQRQVSAEMLLPFVADLEEFAVLEETYRELLDGELDAAGIRDVLEGVERGAIRIVHHTTGSPSPLSFGLATLVDADVVIAEDEASALREYHADVTAAIDGDGESE